MWAVSKGNVGAVEALAPLEMKIVDDDKETALMHAVRERNVECVHLLLEESRAKNAETYTALMIAAKEGIPEVIPELLEHELKMTNGEGQTSLIVATIFN